MKIDPIELGIFALIFFVMVCASYCAKLAIEVLA